LASGLAEGFDGRGGDEFMVSFGSVDTSGWNATRVVEDHAGTFMHELGHTLGLGHGGGDGVLHKPNYYSVMNYTWQTPGYSWQMPNSRRLDYSRAKLPTLVESSLDENAGLGAPAAVWPPTLVPFSDSLVQLDWALLAPGADADWTGDTYVLPNLQVDINLYANSPGDPPTPGQTLVGYQDWEHLVVNYRHSAWYNPDFYNPMGVVPEENALAGDPPPLQELTGEMRNRLSQLPPPKPHGIFVMDGQRDPNSALIASNAGVNLYAAYREGPLGGQLYLAADGAQADRDVAIFVAQTPGAMQAAPLGKSGTVAKWSALLARRGTANAAEWQSEAGMPFDPIVIDSAGSFLEGVVLLDVLLGGKPETYAVALAAYGSAPGAPLLAQAPNGNGNGDVEAGEWVILGTSNVGVPGIPGPRLGLGVRLTMARPNPAREGGSRVRLSLPATADVSATIVNVAGRTVATLTPGRLGPGDHEITWDLREQSGRKAAPGVYFIVVRALGEERSSRVVVLD
jgi:hypothetical protein